jgi:hypothetical protein
VYQLVLFRDNLLLFCLTSYFRSMLPFYGYKKISRIRGRKKHLYTADPDHSSFPCAGPKETRKSKENDLSHSRRSNNYFLSRLTISVRSGSSSPAHSEFPMLHCNIPQRSVCALDTPVLYDRMRKIDADCSVWEPVHTHPSLVTTHPGSVTTHPFNHI